jgi:hypothetical protein
MYTLFIERPELARSLRLTARVLSLASIGTIPLFFIGEGFIPARVAAREWIGLLFFPCGVIAGMIIGWWREGPGGTVTLGSLAGFYLVYGLLLSGNIAQGWAFIAFALPGFLFLLCSLLDQHARR